MQVKIILTRHGHVEGIEPRRFRGARTDIPLTPLGIEQAKQMAITTPKSGGLRSFMQVRWRTAS